MKHARQTLPKDLAPTRMNVQGGSMSSKAASSLYSYVVSRDNGFAPNPFGVYCTLACCKPQIRKHASVGDWVVGTGSKRTVGNDKLVYAMKIEEKVLFNEYAEDPRFQYKIPRAAIPEERGDNIYYKNRADEWVLRQSFYHKTQKQREIDLSGKFVLISEQFFYFGASAIPIPERFFNFIKKGPGHKRLSGQAVVLFLTWLGNIYVPGIHGNPQGSRSVIVPHVRGTC